MSADFEKVLVKDPRLDVSDSIKYAVIKGGQNVTCSPYRAISQTNSQLVFNIQVPSEQTIIDRRVLLQTNLKLQILTTNQSDGAATGCYYGIYSALASFPLHQLFTVMSATINNNTVSINIRDALPVITRLLCCEDLVWYNGTTPTFVDNFASYTPQWGAGWTLNGSNGAIWGTDDTHMPKRGTHPVTDYSYKSTNVGLSETFTWFITEPLLLSPFLFSNVKSNNQGFYGIQNMNFVLNVGNTSRVFRGLTGNGVAPTYDLPSPPVLTSYLDASGNLQSNNKLDYITAVQPVDGTGNLFSDTTLLFNFLTPHPSDLLPARNIVSFYELPRYITPVNFTEEGKAADPIPKYTGSGTNESPYVGGPYVMKKSVKSTVRTNTLQLNQIPDKLIIYVRKSSGLQSWGDADVALPIDTVTINFNNNSGILASATSQQLWQMSRDNGLTSSWLEWQGFELTTVAEDTSGNLTQQPVLPANNTSYIQSNASVGSYLVLEFGKDIQLTEDFYAAGSLGNFNIQVQLVVYNNRPYDINGSNDTSKFEIVMITMNSGVFVCERGTSSTYTGILTKQDVLEASQQDHYTHDDVERLVGGGFFDKIKSGVSKLASKGKDMAMAHGKELLKKHGNKLLEKGKEMASEHGKKLLEKYTS